MLIPLFQVGENPILNPNFDQMDFLHLTQYGIRLVFRSSNFIFMPISFLECIGIFSSEISCRKKRSKSNHKFFLLVLSSYFDCKILINRWKTTVIFFFKKKDISKFWSYFFCLEKKKNSPPTSIQIKL